jgi:hypothetical protein
MVPRAARYLRLPKFLASLYMSEHDDFVTITVSLVTTYLWLTIVTVHGARASFMKVRGGVHMARLPAIPIVCVQS